MLECDPKRHLQPVRKRNRYWGRSRGLGRPLKYDGRSTLTGIVFQRVNGNIVQFTVTGTYLVDSNCIVTDTTFTSTGQTATHTYVVADKGNEFYSLNMTPAPPNVIVGIGKRQFPGDGREKDR